MPRRFAAMPRVVMVSIAQPSDRIEAELSLTADGRIDLGAHLAAREPWPIRRVEAAGAHELELIQASGGEWALRRLGDDDRPLWIMRAGRFVPGELMVLRSPSGDDAIFRVVMVEHEPPPRRSTAD